MNTKSVFLSELIILTPHLQLKYMVCFTIFHREPPIIISYFMDNTQIDNKPSAPVEGYDQIYE